MPTLTCPVPSNISVLNPNGFQFSVQKFPELNYFVQEVSLPGMSLGTALQSSNVHDIKVPGDTMEFEDLSINFLVDEQMDNYLAIQGWIMGLGFPSGHFMYKQWMENTRNAQSYSDNSKAVSDCFLTIIDSDNRPLKRFCFMDAFPTSLSAMTFQSNNTDVSYIVATLTMSYTMYNVC